MRAAINMRTVPGLLAARAAKTPRSPAFRFRRDSTDWEPVAWGNFAERVGRVAARFAQAGLSPGDRIGILAPTCIEWEYTQMGALRLGAVVVGIDPNYPEETRHALLRSLRLSALAVKDAATLERVPVDVFDRFRFIIVFDGSAPPADFPVKCLRGALDAIEPAEQAPESLPGPSAENVAIVAFSSGTSGTPKPIAFTHEQVVLAVEAIVGAFPEIGEGSCFVCWLPLANLFQRVINFCAIAKGATSYIVTDPRSVMNELPSAAPVLLIGVPRFYEHVHEGIENRIASWTGLPGMLGRRGLELLRRRSEEVPAVTDRLLAPILDRWVLSRLRAAFGANLRYLISGSAPMPKRLLRWYESLGLPVYEAYGASENIVPIAMNRPGARRLGTVGQPLPLNDVKLGDDGEILVRGPGMFSGYLDTANARSPRPDGFWPTGDLGELDTDGYLTVTGRKGDAFKSPGGRWIAPEHVEAALQRVPCIGQAVVLGDGLAGIVALAYVNAAALRTRQSSHPAQTSPSPEGAFAPAEKRSLRAELHSALAELPPGGRPQIVLIRGHPFSVEEGELTTNLKVRRRAIAQKYRSVIERAFRELERVQAIPGPKATDLPLVVECE